MPADPDRIGAAQAILAELGVTLADLQRAQRPPVPTMADYLPQVIAAAGPGTRRTYAPYWQRMATAWAGRPLDTITGAMSRHCNAKSRPPRDRDTTAATAGTPANWSSRPHGRCRRGGALGPRRIDLDAERGLVRLCEKGGTLRWQPVSLDLATALADCPTTLLGNKLAVP